MTRGSHAAILLALLPALSVGLLAQGVGNKANPAVVTIIAGRNQVCGFIVDKNGYLVTDPLVAEGTDPILVRIPGQPDSHQALVMGADLFLAVLKIKGVPSSTLATVMLGNSDTVEVGQAVALLRPGGSRSAGRITARFQFLETDIASQASDSGCPVTTASGEVVGMYIHLSKMQFAMPSKSVVERYNEIIAKGAPPPILVLSVQPANVQVYVDDVFKGLTSAEGRLVVEGLAPGAHRVRMNLIGHTESARTVELERGGRATIEAKLEPAGPKPLALAEIEEALTNGISAKRLTTLVNQYGVDFTLTKEVEQRLRDKGADSDLLVAIATNKK